MGHADWAVPDGTDNSAARILYLHGGGYEHYSPQDVYRPATSRLAAAAGMPLLAIDYRLIPEFKHPAQLDDAYQAFGWLAENGPRGLGKASDLFIVGDSAGGGLALALALRLRDQPIPGVHVAGVSVVGPETDLSCSGESYKTRRWKGDGGPKQDPMFRDEDPAAASLLQIYRLLGEPGENGAYSTKDPAISPLHVKLHKLPPIQIHVGDAEVMLNDSVDFASKAKAAGSHVELHVWPHMWHTFTQFIQCAGEDAPPMKEAVEALRMQGEFLKKCKTCASEQAVPK